MKRKIAIDGVVFLGISLLIVFGWTAALNKVYKVNNELGRCCSYFRMANMDIPINQKFIFIFNCVVFILVFILIIKEILIKNPRIKLMVNIVGFFMIISCISYFILNTVSLKGRAIDEPEDFNNMPVRIRK